MLKLCSRVLPSGCTPPPETKRQEAFVRNNGARAIAVVAGFGLLGWLIYRTGVRQLAGNINHLGWGALVIALGGLAHVVKTWAWRFTLSDSKGEVPFSHMLALRLASEAVGQLGFVGTVFGDGLRVSLLGEPMPVATGIGSVALDRALFIISGVVTIALGVIAALLFWPLPHRVAVAGDIFAVALKVVIASAAVAVNKRMPFISAAARAAARIPSLRSRIAERSGAIESVEGQLLNFFHERPWASRAGITLNLACHAAAVLEVWIVLRLLGAPLGLLGALAVEALTKFVNVVGGFNPGNIGTYEGGNMLIGKLFAFGGAQERFFGLWLALSAWSFFREPRDAMPKAQGQRRIAPASCRIGPCSGDSRGRAVWVLRSARVRCRLWEKHLSCFARFWGYGKPDSGESSLSSIP